MKITVNKAELKEIQAFRTLFLQEMNCQIRYHACHERGWSDSYWLAIDDQKVGYGAIKGKEQHTDRDTVFEFYIALPFRKWANMVFSTLLAHSGATFIECQSNDFLLTAMLYEFTENINADTVLFRDKVATGYIKNEVVFRRRKEEDTVFEHQVEPVGAYILAVKGEIIATAGFLLHYNVPFADLYMEVREDWRKKGMGTYILQEVKKECYLNGRVPAARCSISNQASKATLVKAGMEVAGYMLMGKVRQSKMMN